jgi:hypothetical protein
MKTMIVCTGLGLACVGVAFAVKAGLIVLTATQLFALAGSMMLIVGGVAGIVEIYNNRPMRFRKTRRGRN